MDCKYDEAHIDISMPTYVRKYIQKYVDSTPKQSQNALLLSNTVRYGKDSYKMKPYDDIPFLDKKGYEGFRKVVFFLNIMYVQ